MRKFIHTLILIIAFGIGQAIAAETAWKSEYGELLKTYVTPAGVRYKAWHENTQDLQKMARVTEGIGHAEVSQLNPKEQLAFYLNAYNASILDRILHKYPTGGPLDGNPLFFFTTKILVAGKKMTFNDLEQKIIRPQFKEPRVHFALNCASLSCPPLSNRPFDAGDLDQHLDQLAKAFCNSPRAVQLSEDRKSISLSKIFDWYKDDFAKAGGAIAFINRYRQQPLPANLPLRYMSYNWSLNENR